MDSFSTYIILSVNKAKDTDGNQLWECQVGAGSSYFLEGYHGAPKRGDVLIVCDGSKERFLIRTDSVGFVEA